MGNFLKHFYFFSKLTTNFILLLLIIVLGYVFWLSYSANDSIVSEFNDKFAPYLENIDKNSQNLKLLSNKISENNNNFDNLSKNVDTFINSSFSTKYQEQIDKLQKDNKLLKDRINELSVKLEESSLNNNKDDINYKQNKNKNIIIGVTKLLKNKYETGMDISQELVLLDNINKINANKPHIEKLFILSNQSFIGINGLEKEFKNITSIYLKDFFVKNNNNFFIKYLSNFVSVKPSYNSKYDGSLTQRFVEIENKINEKKIKLALKNLKSIEQSEVYFSKWIHQAELYISFFETLESIETL